MFFPQRVYFCYGHAPSPVVPSGQSLSWLLHSFSKATQTHACHGVEGDVHRLQPLHVKRAGTQRGISPPALPRPRVGDTGSRSCCQAAPLSPHAPRAPGGWQQPRLTRRKAFPLLFLLPGPASAPASEGRESCTVGLGVSPGGALSRAYRRGTEASGHRQTRLQGRLQTSRAKLWQRARCLCRYTTGVSGLRSVCLLQHPL